MKLESNSKYLLALTKSKAKMFEFGIAEQYHIDLPRDPEQLLVLTIGILGQLSSIVSVVEVSELDTNAEFLQLSEQLSTVAQYFEALDRSLLREDLSDLLHLLGASSFYLADMPGNSFVLASDISGESAPFSSVQIEEAILWLLKADLLVDINIEISKEGDEELSRFCAATSRFFRQEESPEAFSDIALSLRNVFYEIGSDAELFLIDVLIAIAKKKIWNSSITCLPKYTGIELDQWAESIRKPTFIREFWPAQKLIGRAGILEGKSAVIQMPTSAGKTKSIELIIRSAFLSERARVVVVVAPFRALCREISSTFSKVFSGENIHLNELQDITRVSDEEREFINLLLGKPLDTDPKTIVISTPEKLVYLLRHEPALASQIEMLVFDEGHQFDTGKRGVTYELLLASLKDSVSDSCQIVLISAVMSNTRSIGEWVYQDKGVDIEGNKNIPTVRSVAFTSWQTAQGQLQYIDTEYVAERDYFVPRVIQETNLGTQGRETRDRIFPEKGNNSSVAAYLALKLCHQGPVAVFCGVKSTVTTISELLVNYYDRGLEAPFPVASSDDEELGKIAYLASLHFKDRTILPKSISLGILPHSGNVPNGLRFSVEWAMEHKKACLVICTSTLAQGVNLPIKYLIVTSTFQAGNEISTREFQNLIGRAGRSGYHTEGSIIFADSDVYDKRRRYGSKWKWQRAIYLLDFNNSESCLSSLKELIDPFEFELLDVSVEDYISDPLEYRRLYMEAGIEHGIDVSELLLEIDEKREIIEALESYFLSYLKDNPDLNDSQVFIDLAVKTLAYHLADDEEKVMIVAAFQKISKRVLGLEREKVSYYGKALLGIDQLQRMEGWAENNRFDIEISDSVEDLLRAFWPLLIELFRNQLVRKIQPENLLLELACLWIRGESYWILFDYLNDSGAHYQANTQSRKIKMDHVIDFTDHALGFEAMLYVGALADIFEGKGWSEELVDKTRFLQSSLKLGLSAELDFWLYRMGYVDREICKLISEKLISSGAQGNRIDYKVLEKHDDEISEILLTLPSYFSDFEV